MMGGQREYRQNTDYREKRKRKTDSERNYLNLTTFHQCAVKLFPGFFGVGTGLECHKAKALES